MCFNEKVCDATDVLCDILPRWNTLLLEEYNYGLLEDDHFENIKDLLNSDDDLLKTKIQTGKDQTSKNQTVWERIDEKVKDLGGVIRDEIFEMGSYKLA